MSAPHPPARILLADTSAWIEYLRATGSKVDTALTDALLAGGAVAVTGVVVQEVLQGCRGAQVDGVRRLLLGCAALEAVYPETYEHAAALYRHCRTRGLTIRKTVDCLVAAVALEHGAELLALDRDFEAVAKVTALRFARP